MSSNVGNAQVYEAGDQRNAPESEQNTAERFEEGKSNSHQANDSKDERSIANKLAAETKKEKEGDEDSEETKMIKEDPTALAKSHGNKPSRGAEIDKQIQEEEAEILAKKGSFGPNV